MPLNGQLHSVESEHSFHRRRNQHCKPYNSNNATEMFFLHVIHGLCVPLLMAYAKMADDLIVRRHHLRHDGVLF